jgi:hypothetical protein
MSLDDVDATMLTWRDVVGAGRAVEEGWPEWINIPSKVSHGRRHARVPLRAGAAFLRPRRVRPPVKT